MPLIRLSPRAKTDLIEIWTYIADDSVANADAFVDHLNDTIQLLAARGILSFPFRRYVIFYRANTDSIEIVRVLHGARDIHSIFES